MIKSAAELAAGDRLVRDEMVRAVASVTDTGRDDQHGFMVWRINFADGGWMDVSAHETFEVIDMKGDNTEMVDNFADIIYAADLERAIAECQDLIECDPEVRMELERLSNVWNQAEKYGSFENGGYLIRETFFTDYIREYVKSEIEGNHWAETLSRHTDWEAVAEEYKADYAAVDFDGVTYYVRAY